MAIKTVSGHVTSGNQWNKQQQSCLGFAGNSTTGAGHATFIQVDFDWTATIDDDLKLKLNLKNFRFRCSESGGLLNSSYQWYMSVMRNQKTMPTSPPSDVLATTWFSYDFGGDGGSRATLDYSPGTNVTWNLGDALQWDYNNDGTIDIYIGGCSTYSVTDPVYPVSIPIRLVAGEDGGSIADLLDYYPWARIIDGELMSHNRIGGKLRRQAEDDLTDVLNSELTRKTNHGFRYNGETWVRSPKTGKGA